MNHTVLHVGLFGLAVTIVANVLARATFLDWSLFDPKHTPSIGFLALGDLLVLAALAARVLFIRLRQQA